jgi:plastocyanin
MTRMRSILLSGGTSLVLVLTACSSSSPSVAGNSSGVGSSGASAPAGAGNLPASGSTGSSAPAVAGNPAGAVGSGSSAPAVAGRSSGGGSIAGGPGLVAVRSGTAATGVKETDYLQFVPASVNVKVGDIVDFTNAGAILHNVTFPYAGIGSPTMKRGSSFLVKFTSPGTYSYVCTLHFSVMLGTVTVR